MDEEWWARRHREILALDARRNAEILFIGDSITNNWGNTGRKIWDQYYAPRNAINLGFNGDKTENVLWRIENGEIDNCNPKVVVLLIGTNNRDAAHEIAEGIRLIVKQLKIRLPESKILLLGIFPRGRNEDRKNPEIPESGRNHLWDTNDQANAILSENQQTYYLDIGREFLRNGNVQRAYMPDFLHPNEEGYRVWAGAMEPTLRKLLGEK